MEKSSWRNCLICYCKLELQSVGADEINEDDIESDNEPFGSYCQLYSTPRVRNKARKRELHQVLFILRNVLDISSEELEEFVRLFEEESSSSLEKLSFCNLCKGEVNRVKDAFLTLQEVSRKFEKSKYELKEKMKAFSMANLSDGDDHVKAGFMGAFWKLVHGIDKADMPSTATDNLEAFVPEIEFEIQDEGINIKKDNIEYSVFSSCDSSFSEADEEDMSFPEPVDMEIELDPLYVPEEHSPSFNLELTSKEQEVAYFSESQTKETKSKKIMSNSGAVGSQQRTKLIQKTGQGIRKIRASTTSGGQPFISETDLKRYSCALCDNAKNLNFNQFVDHVDNLHLIFYRCSKSNQGFKDPASKLVTQHWLESHKELMADYPILEEKVEKIDAVLPPFPSHCPLCLAEFTDESARDAHLESCKGQHFLRKTIRCRSCPEMLFYTTEELQLHSMASHPKLPKPPISDKITTGPIKCDQCSIRLSNEDRWRTHRIKVHNLDLHKCDLCKEEFVSKMGLHKHRFTVHQVPIPGKLFKCDIEGCGKEFLDRSNFSRHKRIHAGTLKVHKCRFCAKTFNRRNRLEKHERKEHLEGDSEDEDVPAECPDCGRRLKSESALKSHLYRCTGEKKRFDCAECKMTFSTKDNFDAHNLFQHDIKPVTPSSMEEEKDVTPSTSFECAHCPKKFSTVTQLKIHEHCHKNDTKKRFLCTICDIEHDKRYKYDQHMAQVHNIGVEKFKCEKCQLIFPNPTRRAKHKCGEDKPEDWYNKHVCKHCGAHFRHIQQFRRHVIYEHEKVFPFVCSLCEDNRGFVEKKEYLSHMAAVHQVGDWKCEVEGCGKVFTSQKELDEHDRYKHKGEKRPKNYICSSCDAAFAALSYLKTHYSLVHSNAKPYKCKFCPESFPTASYRSAHMKKHKNNI